MILAASLHTAICMKCGPSISSRHIFGSSLEQGGAATCATKLASVVRARTTISWILSSSSVAQLTWLAD
eukprot:CAMPEP_0169282062 /NCGR_PEP_ID=MMETSP1016-20121227/56656_1 /TAXON_ID=342587 /ORGANISM="Karlodinium micrum, Strain CCMP2283" /LENGTH=68 /DNA_ID=CAMNT_0009370861 /DNA_START=132 /DNA_END=338 /DNA_ORIENTATION=-